MHFLLLFGIGGAIGGLAGAAARMQTHRARFNIAVAGIFGAVLGGLALPRAIGSAAPSPALAAVGALALVSALIGVRHWLAHRG
jgi:hypothetical protein